MSKQWTKMSKSGHNIVTPDEVTYGVESCNFGYEFRFKDGTICDFKAYGVWQNKNGGNFFYTSTITGRIPIYLYYNEEPCIVFINGQEVIQHSLAPAGCPRDASIP
jgi:hypothetical protein